MRGLPPESATRQAIEGEAYWSLTDHLLAHQIDVLAAANWQRANMNLERHKRSRPPKPFPRPGVARPAITTAALLAHRERTTR